MKWIISVIALLLLSTGIAAQDDTISMEAMWNTGVKPFRGEGFIEPDVCSRCHSDIFDMWEGSAHSLATKDPLFVAASKLFVEQTANEGEKADAEHCIACHNPIAYRSGQIKGSSDSYDNVNAVTMHSISCDMCHTIDEIVQTRNALFNTAPGDGEDNPGIKRGPHDNVESMYHESAYSAIHTDSAVCGACHNVTHMWYMTKLEGTYDEWFHSPYNSPDPAQRVTCQDCHMRQAPGNPATGMTERPDYPGSSAMMGEERPHIYRHYVVGGNTLLPRFFDRADKADLARERLRHAAELEIMPNEDNSAAFTVRITNAGAGHMLPTGVTEYREMWLEVTVKDANGTVVLSSGKMSPDGTLPSDTRLFNTVFGDSDGNPTVNVTKAAMVLTDRRIMPKGHADEGFTLPDNTRKPLTVTAALKYRSFNPGVAASLIGDKGKDIPVVVMAEVESTLR